MPVPVYSVISDLNLKMAWAEKHLEELQTLLRRYREFAEKKTVTKHDDVLRGRYVVRYYCGVTPSDVPLLLSDFIYATRSALDHLAWQLARKTIPIPSTETLFPIHASNNAKSEGKFKSRTRGMPPDAIDEIRKLQPYHRGAAYRDDPLWKLNELSNIDKHRIFAVHANVTDIFVFPGGYSVHNFDYGSEFSWPLAMKDRVVFEPYTAELVFGKPVDLPGDVFEVRQPEIAEIHRYVRDDVLPRFSRFFS